jgi:hypothetical protein
MLDAEVLIAHLIGAVLGVENDLIQGWVGHKLSASGALRQAIKLALYHIRQPTDVGANLFEYHNDDTGFITADGAQQMQRRENGVGFGHCNLLSSRQGFLRL